jgi:hypothetical protein
MDRNLVAKICVGLGLGILAILYHITNSSSFESSMLNLTNEQNDSTTMLLVGGLGLSTCLLIAGRILYRKPKADSPSDEVANAKEQALRNDPEAG